ncbi:MAG: hypothetical protein KC897_11215 [Candidatus Omnitrophica bacterium]|nr:hypothetical protein [Candidatus Omnitrophota bacterium]
MTKEQQAARQDAASMAFNALLTNHKTPALVLDEKGTPDKESAKAVRASMDALAVKAVIAADALLGALSDK